MTTQNHTDLDKLILSIQELHKSTSELKESTSELKESTSELKESQAKTDQQMQKTDKRINALTQNLEGVNRSRGKEAEEFFLSSLQNTPRLGDIEFDIVSRQMTKKIKEEKYQMDIFLENGNSVGIVEVKNKAKREDIDQLDTLMTRFEKFYTTHTGMKKYGAIAAKIMPEDIELLALKKGYFVLKQQGNHVEVIPPKSIA